MRIAVLILLFAIVSACSINSNKKSISKEVGTITLELTKLWKAQVGKGNNKNKEIALTPAVEEEYIYLASVDGALQKRTQKDGSLLWEKYLQTEISSPIGLGEHNLYLGNKDGYLFALDKKTGELRWRQQLSSEILASVAEQNSVVITHLSDDSVYGLNESTGEIIWSYKESSPNLKLMGSSSPRVIGDFVIVGFSNGRLALFSIIDGSMQWEYPLALPEGRSEVERLVDIVSSPVIDNNLLYAVSYQGKIAAINLDTGQIVWQQKMSSYKDMAIDLENVYLTAADGSVLAFNKFTGDVLWRQENLKFISSSAPIISSQYVVVGTNEGDIKLLDKTNGEIVNTFHISNSPIAAKPLFANGMLFIYSQAGMLLALENPN